MGVRYYDYLLYYLLGTWSKEKIHTHTHNCAVISSHPAVILLNLDLNSNDLEPRIFS